MFFQFNLLMEFIDLLCARNMTQIYESYKKVKWIKVLSFQPQFWGGGCAQMQNVSTVSSKLRHLDQKYRDMGCEYHFNHYRPPKS